MAGGCIFVSVPTVQLLLGLYLLNLENTSSKMSFPNWMVSVAVWEDKDPTTSTFNFVVRRKSRCGFFS